MSAALSEKLQSGAISAVIFDLDGVLIDSTSGIVESTNFALQEIGSTVRTTLEIKRYIGSPLQEMFEVFAPGIDYGEIRPHFKARAMEVIVESTELLPFARETLDRFRALGLKLGIGSTKIRSHISGIIEKFDLHTHITSYTGGDEATPKPAPDIFLTTCERLGADPVNSLVVGDTINDTLAAQSAGAHIVSIESDFGDRESMQSNPAERHFANLAEFSEYVMSAVPQSA